MVANGFEGVPWAIGGGAKQSADVGRLLAYAASGGGEGIVDPVDCKVTATAGTADNYVHIGRGALVVRNRSANAYSQSYMTRAIDVTDLQVAPTGSSPRSDLVVVRIKDPQFPPWQAPSDVVNGPYAIPEIIPGVAANTTSATQLGLSQSFVAVARIDQPAGAPKITQQMVVDLRQLAQERNHRSIEQSQPTPEDTLNSTAGRIWPDFRPRFYVPVWATGAVITANMASVGLRGGSTQGVFTVVMNGPAQGVGGFRGQDTGWDLDAPSQGGARHTLTAVGGFNDIRSIAGTWTEIRLEARETNVANEDLGHLVTVAGTQLQFDVQFFQAIL